ncbi:hypothetical protein D3C72_2434230 [compost metagenome]
MIRGRHPFAGVQQTSDTEDFADGKIGFRCARQGFAGAFGNDHDLRGQHECRQSAQFVRKFLRDAGCFQFGIGR